VNQAKKWIGISSAILTSAVLVLSLTGLVGPGCGGGSDDACQAACQKVATCSASSSSSSGFDMIGCVQSCQQSASSASSSSRDSYNVVVECVAQAPTCLAMGQCVGSSGSF
jgi:hypothetical protein